MTQIEHKGVVLLVIPNFPIQQEDSPDRRQRGDLGVDGRKERLEGGCDEGLEVSRNFRCCARIRGGEVVHDKLEAPRSQRHGLTRTRQTKATY